MPIGLRIPSEKEEMIREMAARAGKSKTAYILEAIDEKLGLVEDREQTIRELTGWMSHEEAEELRASLEVFSENSSTAGAQRRTLDVKRELELFEPPVGVVPEESS